MKVELLPPELLLAPTSLAKKSVAEELKNVLLKLEELQENTGNLSIDADSENYVTIMPCSPSFCHLKLYMQLKF